MISRKTFLGSVLLVSDFLQGLLEATINLREGNQFPDRRTDLPRLCTVGILCSRKENSEEN